MTQDRERLVTRPFMLVTAGGLAYFTAYAMLIPALPRYVERALHGGKVAVGVAVGAFAFTALLFRPFAGAFGDRRGRRMLIIAGAAIVALSNVGIAATSTMAPLIAMRLLAGAGEAAVFVGAISAINDLASPARRGEAVSLFSVSLYAGIAVGPLIGEWLLGAHGFNAVWLVAAAGCIVTVALGVVVGETKPPDLVPSSRRGIARVLHPAGVFPGLVMLTSVIGFAGYTAFVPLYVERLGLDGARVVLLMYGSILVAIRLFGARIPDVIGVARAGRAGQAASVAGLATIGLWRSVPGLFAGSAIFAIGQALTFPAFMALAIGSAPPADSGAAAGTLTAFIDLGFGIGPIFVGALSARWDEPTAFLGSAAVAAVGLVIQGIWMKDRAHSVAG